VTREELIAALFAVINAWDRANEIRSGHEFFAPPTGLFADQEAFNREKRAIEEARALIS
jgi:hypothetical protein